MDGQNGVSAERYEAVMRMILSDTKKALPGVKLILMAPYLLKDAVTKDYAEQFKEGVDKRAKIVEKLATEFGAAYISLQNVFDRACQNAPAYYWARDGVHATPAGHQLIADAWLDTFKNIC